MDGVFLCFAVSFLFKATLSLGLFAFIALLFSSLKVDFSALSLDVTLRWFLLAIWAFTLTFSLSLDAMGAITVLVLVKVAWLLSGTPSERFLVIVFSVSLDVGTFLVLVGSVIVSFAWWGFVLFPFALLFWTIASRLLEFRIFSVFIEGEGFFTCFRLAACPGSFSSMCTVCCFCFSSFTRLAFVRSLLPLTLIGPNTWPPLRLTPWWVKPPETLCPDCLDTMCDLLLSPTDSPKVVDACFVSLFRGGEPMCPSLDVRCTLGICLVLSLVLTGKLKAGCSGLVSSK